MTIDRAHAAEDEYFRKQEAERRQDDARELQRVPRAERAEQEELEALRVRQAAPAAAMTPRAQRDTRRGLNRLIVAGCGELLVLGEGARLVPGSSAQRSLRDKAERRRVFGHDLGSAVVTLGGVPAKRASLRALGMAWARSLRRLLAGPHRGDAYAACARAAERTSREYSRVLRLGLPDDVRFGLEQQHAEVELDCRELRRLRWM